jgi:hypothetical protein
MTSLERESGRTIAMADVKERVRQHFQRLLDTWLPPTHDA